MLDAPPSAPLARFTLDAGVATITLDRDAKRNAFDTALADAVTAGIARAEDDAARAVIIRANDGAKVFSAGHDLAEMRAHGVVDDETDAYWRMIARVQASPLPVIVAVGAPVLAGGVLLVAVADIAIGTPAATATMTANRMGVPFRAETYAVLVQVMGLKKAKELMLTAAPLSPEEGLRCGLWNHVVPQRELIQAAQDIAARIAALSAEGVALSKGALNGLAAATGLADATAAALDQARRARLASPDLAARVAALLDGLKR
jgi:methylmalonyl-CoA decarboxylase